MKPHTQEVSVPYEALFVHAPEGLAYCRMMFGVQKEPLDFVFIETNNSLEKRMGMKGITGKKITELIPGIHTSNPELFDICGRVALSGMPEKFETYIKSLSTWFLVSVASPHLKFFMVMFQDITDRKIVDKNLDDARIAARNVLEDLQVEKEALAQAKAKDDAILESLGEGLVAVDNDGRIMVMNKVAIDMIGWKLEDVVGRVVTDFRLENEAGLPVPLDERPTNIALATGKLTKVTSFFVRKNKTRFPIAITATPIRLNGKIIGLIEIIRDVTREKEIDRAKSEFVSLASHQLRTPLTTVSWYAEMILRGDVGEIAPDQKKYIDEIYRGNRQMIELVNTLLDISRIEMGTFSADLKPTDIQALAKDVLEEQKQKIDTKRLTIIRKFGEDISTCSTDPKLLRMIFQNLISNAVEYTPQGGTIEFSLSFEDMKFLHVHVSDTGYGIPQSQQHQIFQKFFRADNVKEKDTEGTGLGLYIVKSIIQNLNGKISFESEENKGTTFYVTIPIHTS